MIQDLGEHCFNNSYRPGVCPADDSPILFYRGREIFIKTEGDERFPVFGQLKQSASFRDRKPTLLFSIDGKDYFLYRDLPDEDLPDESNFPGFSWERIEVLRRPDDVSAFAGVTGMQLYSWYKSRRFCPACGSKMQHDERERMMYCPACGQKEYPKICPAVIVAVTDNDRLLLTKYADGPTKNYALVAGFAEIGETIEDTARREVMEETGLKIKNLQYYKSQPWSFTDTLLMGFFAEVDGSRKITLQRSELSVGKWCTRDEIPEDNGVSLTSEMMGVFKRGGRPFHVDTF